jgi:hypothetical protein
VHSTPHVFCMVNMTMGHSFLVISFTLPHSRFLSLRLTLVLSSTLPHSHLPFLSLSFTLWTHNRFAADTTSSKPSCSGRGTLRITSCAILRRASLRCVFTCLFSLSSLSSQIRALSLISDRFHLNSEPLSLELELLPFESKY